MAKKARAELSQAVPSGAANVKDGDVENDYETQNHLRTIMDAHGIINDKVKMLKVHKLAGRHHKAIKSIKDIKHVYDEKYGVGALKNKSDMDGDE
jgi:hypothetical protein